MSTTHRALVTAHLRFHCHTLSGACRDSVGLHDQGPPRETPIGILHFLKPCEGLVISLDRDWLAFKVHIEVGQCPHYGQAFFLDE